MKEIFLYGEKEIAHLKKVDPAFGKIIDQIGLIERRVIPDVFTALIHSIVGQQISTKAAETVWRRMEERFKEITPGIIDAASVDEIQQLGMSVRKASYIKAAARKVVCGELDIELLPTLSDEEVCRQLSALNGIGVWTAEMLMTFSMQRPDILSWGDLAIHRGLRMLHQHSKIDRELFEKYRLRYSPYNTVASLYLWAIAGGACGLKDCAPMNTQQNLDFARIAEAIEYIRENFKSQPTLEDVAGKVGLSTAHFQRMFTEWAGVSPKKFLQYISIEYAKKVLSASSLSDAAFETGLSGTGRLHDLFVNIEGMTPGEYKNGGEQLCINYSFADSPFGDLLVAATPKGICHLAFTDGQIDGRNGQADSRSAQADAFQVLQQKFPNARYEERVDTIQQNALFIFTQDWSKLNEIKLHLKGTDFQLKVWDALLRIPAGGLSTYSEIASQLNNPKAMRAVGTAIGDNPVAFLIPCHRVIRSSGELGGYHWGLARKAAIIGWEATRNNISRSHL